MKEIVDTEPEPSKKARKKQRRLTQLDSGAEESDESDEYQATE